MKTIRLLSIIAAFAVISLTACGDDDPAKPPVAGPSPYKNLTEREHVLDNLELSYVQRNLFKYEELLDDDFEFYLSAEDVGGGLPEFWTRGVEVTVHTNLFDPNFSGSMPACESILLDIDVEAESPLWKLVEMRDLGGTSGPATTSLSTEPSTWGSVKSLYR